MMQYKDVNMYDSTKPLPEPMLTFHSWGSVVFVWEQFHSTQATILCKECENCTYKITAMSPRGHWVDNCLANDHWAVSDFLSP